MHTVRTSEAAAYLNVSPNTLRSWEQRFGFPRPQRSPGRQRIYPFAELVALREALTNGLTVSSAVSLASDATAVDENALTAALLSFNYDHADRVMERGLSLGTPEGAMLQVLLPALGQIEVKAGRDSAPWAFASRWADEWLSRTQRLAVAADGSARLLFADCFDSSASLDWIRARMLEVFCVRAGMSTLRLPVSAGRSLERATAAFAPNVLVLGGQARSPRDVEAFIRVVRTRARPLTCMRYLCPDRMRGSTPLPDSPALARDDVLKHLQPRSRPGLP